MRLTVKTSKVMCLRKLPTSCIMVNYKLAEKENSPSL